MGSRTEDKLYEEVLEMIENNQGEVPDYDDKDFCDATYKIGLSARRTAEGLHWHGGKSIRLSHHSDGEVRFLQNTTFDAAKLMS